MCMYWWTFHRTQMCGIIKNTSTCHSERANTLIKHATWKTFTTHTDTHLISFEPTNTTTIIHTLFLRASAQRQIHSTIILSEFLFWLMECFFFVLYSNERASSHSYFLTVIKLKWYLCISLLFWFYGTIPHTLYNVCLCKWAGNLAYI